MRTDADGCPAAFGLSFLLCFSYFYKLAMPFPTSSLGLATLSLLYFLHQPHSLFGVCIGGVFPYFQNFGIQTWRAKAFLWAYSDSTQDHSYAYNIMGKMEKNYIHGLLILRAQPGHSPCLLPLGIICPEEWIHSSRRLLLQSDRSEADGSAAVLLDRGSINQRRVGMTEEEGSPAWGKPL